MGSTFHKLLYAMKFGDANIFLSSRVNANSQILYDRTPRERVQKVAPWLTVDRDALPAVVDGQIVWILDGYTTSDKYPLSERRSLEEMISDALNPRQTYATLPTDHINYMRNAVKAVVDAYNGNVKLYAWDESDPLLKAWEEVFPGVVKPSADIPDDLLAHMRYPEDLYKVQRNVLADYHVTNPNTFYRGSDKWDVPQDPEAAGRKQPPYRLSVATRTARKPVFSLTSVYVPTKRQNLASFMAVGADASDPSTYGKIQILRLPDNTQVPGPSQIANQFNSDDAIATRLQIVHPEQRPGALRQPAHAARGRGPALRAAAVHAALQRRGVVPAAGVRPGLVRPRRRHRRDPGRSPGRRPRYDDEPATAGTDTGSGGTATGTGVSGDALKLLQQANDKFAAADKALKDGDLEAYAKNVDEAQSLVDRAIALSDKPAPKKSGN